MKIEEDVFDICVDACLPRKYVEELEDRGYRVLYICDSYDPSMPDNEVKAIARRFHIPIATANIRHFDDFDNLIPLRPRNAKKLVAETLKYLE